MTIASIQQSSDCLAGELARRVECRQETRRASSPAKRRRMSWFAIVVFLAAVCLSAAARAEDPLPTTPREMFRTLGVADSCFEQLTNDVALDSEETDSLLRILYRMRQFPPADLESWALDQEKLGEAVRRPGTFRGSIFQLRGQVLDVVPLRPTKDQSERYEMKRYFRCRLSLDSPARIVDVFTEQVPAAWQNGVRPKVEGGALGAFLKIGPKTGKQSPLIFVAPRLAWYSDDLLGRLGMDYGLLDDLISQKKLTDRQREILDRDAFYAMFAAVNRAAPGQLVEEADAALPHVSAKRRWINREGQEQYSVVPLFNEPASQVGKLVVLSGTARRIEKIHVDDPEIVARYGFDHYYMVSLFTEDCYAPTASAPEDYLGNPVTFDILELPEGMPYGSQPHYGEAVRIAGFFYKTWQYRVQKNADVAPTPGEKTRPQLSPLLIGRSLVWNPPTKAADQTTSNVVIISLLFLAMLIIWVVAWRSSRREKRWVAGATAGPPKFGDDIDLSRIDQRDESQPDFGRIAEMDHSPETVEKTETTEKKDDDSTLAPPQ